MIKAWNLGSSHRAVPLPRFLAGWTCAWNILARAETGAPGKPGWRSRFGYPGALLALMLAYVVIVGGLAGFRHQRYGSYAFDLGIYDQALWLIAHGYRPDVTVRGLHILGDHFTPVLYPLSLLYWGEGGTQRLLWFQTIALALGALPLFRLTTRLTGERWPALMVSVCYLCYPPLRGLNLFDFHPVALATPALLAALDFAEERRPVPLALACAWMLLCKQEAGMVVACLGVWYAVRWKQPRSLALAAAGAGWLLLALRLQARFAGSDETAYAALYPRLGRGVPEIVLGSVLHPLQTLGLLDGREMGAYLLLLLAPLALLPLLQPGTLWLLLGPLALNAFSSRPSMRTIDYQYTALLIPVLFVAAVRAFAKVPPGKPRLISAGAWVCCAVGTGVLVTPVLQRLAIRPVLSAPEAAGTRALLASLPAQGSVSATSNLVPHLTGRRQVYLFPNPFVAAYTGPGMLPIRQGLGQSDPVRSLPAVAQALDSKPTRYILIGYRLFLRREADPLESRLSLLVAVLQSARYGLTQDEEGVWILERGADHAAGLRRLGLAPDATGTAIREVIRKRWAAEAKGARPDGSARLAKLPRL